MMKLYGKAVREGCVGQLRAMLLEEPLAYRMLMEDVVTKQLACWGHDWVPLCIAITEYRELAQKLGAGRKVHVEEVMAFPDPVRLVGEVMISIDVE